MLLISHAPMWVKPCLRGSTRPYNFACIINEFHMMAISHWWVPLARASNTKLWCFLWCAREQTAEQTVQMLVIRDAMTLMMASLWWFIAVVEALAILVLGYTAYLTAQMVEWSGIISWVACFQMYDDKTCSKGWKMIAKLKRSLEVDTHWPISR